ncbi:putative ATP-dependent RNA helicase SoYb [Drosophila erecta]|uniref:RNA helicase n=1 Tax=Drosophila erecta TaxID=7220 RepID=B3NTW5_DROER|nr:putative ATP-dependent RNA helicase SoYb [Drosophila erecta]EDV45673.1 uncharacterized protein Dere_GG18624 [Drosophila erecta]
MKPIGDHQVPSFKVESRGTCITYASPRSGAAAHDFLAHTLQEGDAHKCRTILICQQNCEAERLKSELAERDVKSILLLTHDPMARQVLLLWSKGYIHQALILCDDMLEYLGGVEANLVIHTTLPELNTFEERMKWLSGLKVKAEMMVITPRHEEDNKKEGKDEVELPLKDIKPVVKVAPPNSKKTHETKETMPNSTTATISKNDEEHRMSLSVRDTMEKRLESTNPETSNSLEKLQLDQLSLEVKNTDLAMDESSLAAGKPNAPGDAHLNAEHPTGASEAEFQKLKAWKLRNASKDMALPPPPSLPIEKPPGLELPDTTTSDLGVVDDTTSLDSITTVQDYPASPAVEPSSAAGQLFYNYGVLTWSRHLVVPCYDLGGAPEISTAIRQAMFQLGVAKFRARAVQRFAWPHVSSGKSAIVVGNMQIGKTWSYLPTVCQSSHKELQCRPADGHGPSCIFVCPNQSQGKPIGRWMATMFRSLGSEVAFEDVVTLWDKSHVADIVCRLSRPVGILLTSVDSLLELLGHHTRNSPIFDAQAVKCIALDNLNDMIRLLPDATMKLLKRLPEMIKLTQGQTKCNVFVSGRIWHTDLMVQRILPLMPPDVLILFEDALEASVYGGVQLDIKVVEGEVKIEHLMRLIERRNRFVEERAVVVCSSSTEVRHLRRKLNAMGGVNVQTIVSSACYSKWSTAGLLLITDEVVPKLRCGKITLLIHYSLDTSWMRFKHRFVLFYENLRLQAPRSVGQSVIFVKSTDVDSIWMLSDFLLKHELPRPIHLLDIISQRRLTEPQQPRGQLKLCRQLTAFGDCLRHTCSYRHVLWQHEVLPPKHYPTAGQIRFSVLTCNSPATLSVRLSDQFPTVVNFLNVPMTQLGKDVQRHYEVEENRRRHPNPVPGERAVVKNLNRYERADIVNVENNGKVAVQLLDTSTEVVSSNASQVYICDELFKEQPREAMEVRITGLEPQSLDRLWPEDVRNMVRKQFFNRRQNNRSRQFHAVIQATIQQTIFVRDVHDEEGNDLSSFVTNRFRAHHEQRCLDKLTAMVQSAREFPPSS